jgi:hypothetical protein
MSDIEDPDDPDEEDWSPPVPQPDTWAKWEPRALQVFALHAFALGVVTGLHLTGLVSRKTANVLLACQAPALACAWAGLIAYLVVRSRERSEGRAERGRMLVVMLDVFTAVLAVLGTAAWLAVLTR